jgi:hypothetical protein
LLRVANAKEGSRAMTNEEMEQRLESIAKLLGLVYGSDSFILDMGDLFYDIDKLKPVWDERYWKLKQDEQDEQDDEYKKRLS